ncbi:41671_t:CDS:2 [Gigaspora margarita]|uniref:41671_t:CDS:1 n=1 Tax=Gigaspora margarita TaxID=4874 RepID=A0ABM8W7E0_GIGMA|nr:41671_t:CDS:2 [Gigaspora margarita]
MKQKKVKVKGIRYIAQSQNQDRGNNIEIKTEFTELEAIAMALLAIPSESAELLYLDSENTIKLVKKLVEKWDQKRKLKLQNGNESADKLTKAGIKRKQEVLIVSSWNRSMRMAPM